MTVIASTRHSVAALLGGAVDYAGTFPPAQLSLEEAVANYVHYCRGPEAWLLGCFVCPASQLAAIPDLFAASAGRGGISVIVEDAGSFERAARSPFVDFIQAFEVRSGDDPAMLGNDLERTFAAAAARGFCQATMYVEIPADADPKPFAAAIAAANRRRTSDGGGAGLKFRTGGLTPAAVPTSKRMAENIVACRDAGLFWKATAGLHQPFRHLDPTLGIQAHGFINLFVAATIVDAFAADANEIAAVLDDEQPDHFRFTPDGVSWRDRTMNLTQINGARRHGLHSFGSCSFTEPVEGLKLLRQ